MSKVISDAELLEYRNRNRADNTVATAIAKARTAKTQADTIDQLVLSVSQAVQGAGAMNREALGLIQEMFQRLVLTHPVIPAPTVYMPDPPLPAKRWRFTVQRDSSGLIAEVVAERLDDTMPGEDDL